MGQEFQDDNSIQNEDDLWRRVMPAQIVHDHNLGTSRPSSAAFEDSPDGSPMSAIWEKLHRQQNLTEADALAGHTGFGLVSFKVSLARELNQGIQRDPVEDAPAHVLVFGPKTKSVRRKLAAGAQWVIEP